MTLDRFASPFRSFGALAGTVYLTDRLLQRLTSSARIHLYELVAQPISGKALLPASLLKNFEFREVGRDDPDLRLMPPPAAVMEGRFAQGARCLGMYKRERLVGYLWLAFQRYEEDEVRCTYLLASPDESVFDFDFYLFPENRMGIGFAALWNGANTYLGSLGIKRTFSRISRFNLASRRAHKHLGASRIGIAAFLQVGAFEMMVGTLRPFAHVSVRRSSRARLRL